MASLVTHPIVPLSLALAAGQKTIPWQLVLLGMLASMLPDADVIAFRLGIPYGHMLGHRGLSHSLVFAVLLAVVIAGLDRFKARRLATFLFIFAATASHGMLDALTTGGKGVGFLIPFTDERYFFSIRPILVSPLTAHEFFTARGLAILISEIQAVWAPCAAVAICGIFYRRLTGRA